MTIRNAYFLSSNSGRGHYEYFSNEIKSLDYVYLLKGSPGNGKSQIIEHIANKLNEQKINTELVYSSFNIDTLDGVINLDKNIGVFDASHPNEFENILPKISGEIIDLSEIIDFELLQSDVKYIKEIQKEKEYFLQKYSDSIIKARKLHDDLEKYFSNSINIEKAQKLNDGILKAIFNNRSLNKQSIVKHRFFDTITEDGNFDLIQKLTGELDLRYFIKGRPGSGKSTLLKQIVAQATSLGFNIELYHCDFDPESLDLVIIPELSICAFDSTAPHNYEPEVSGDYIVDTYQSIIENNIDERYQKEIEEGTKSWEKSADEAYKYLKEAKEIHNNLANLYYHTVDKDKINEITNKLILSIS